MTSHNQPAERALFEMAPTLRNRIPHIPLGAAPTPVDRVSVAGLSLLVKRDDLTADGYGGNKVRKLEFLLAEARAAGAQRLVTAGAAGSHHAFATAWHGRQLGFESTLVLFPQRRTPHVLEMLALMASTGAELRWVGRMEAVPFGMWRARIASRSARPFTIAPGGSNITGTLGYVNAGLEFAAQVAAEPELLPSSVHVAAGTLGTAAGLAVGFAWAGLDVPIIATRITSRLVTNERVLRSLVRGAVDRLRSAGADPPAAADALRLVTLHHDQLGTGYGHETDEGRAATEAFAEAGLTLDATYTAKAAASLLAGAGSEAGKATDPAPPLFWHTLSAHHPELAPADVPLPPAIATYMSGDDVA